MIRITAVAILGSTRMSWNDILCVVCAPFWQLCISSHSWAPGFFLLESFGCWYVLFGSRAGAAELALDIPERLMQRLMLSRVSFWFSDAWLPALGYALVYVVYARSNAEWFYGPASLDATRVSSRAQARRCGFTSAIVVMTSNVTPNDVSDFIFDCNYSAGFTRAERTCCQRWMSLDFAFSWFFNRNDI